MPQKICPRCGSSFANLKSATCPTCFAKLLDVDDNTAAQVAAERARIEQSDEYRVAKAEDDEAFRHQSFQACLGVIGLGLVTLFVIAFAIINARHHDSQLRAAANRILAEASARPLAQASVGDVMPAAAGNFHREKMDQETDVSGTVTVIYHAAYLEAGAAAIDVYGISASRTSTEQERFRDLVKLLASAGTQQRTVLEQRTQPFLYEIVGPPAASIGADEQLHSFQLAWRKQVGGY